MTRCLDWTEILFYQGKGRNWNWDETTRFTNRDEDLKLARVLFNIGDLKFTGTLGCTSGHVFTLAIRPSIKPHAFKEIDRIRAVKVLQDPTIPSPPKPKPKYKLPTTYTDFINATQKQDTNGWSVLQPEEVYSIALSDADYLMLAERQGTEYLLSRDRSPSNGIFYCESPDSTPKLKRGSLERIMQESNPSG